MITPGEGARLIDALTTVVSEAGAAILAARAGALNARAKADSSPVTVADEAANTIILAALTQIFPGVPVVTEEAVEAPPPLGDTFILVDPLDGTRELLAGRDEFTVNIALISGGTPVLGVVGAPALAACWSGLAGQGAQRMTLTPGAPVSRATERKAIRTRAFTPDAIVATVSLSHPDAKTDAFLARFASVQRISVGSSVKFCRVAEGGADVYPRFGTTCEWDIAAGHAVLAAAGGAVTQPDGQPLSYGKSSGGFRVPGFLAFGDPAQMARLTS